MSYHPFGAQKVKCPYYRDATPTSITCEGYEDERQLIRLIYRTTEEAKAQRKNFCESACYEGCPIYQIASEKYEDA